MISLEQNILRGIKQVLGNSKEFTALHEPEFTGNEWNIVKDCLDSTFVSSVGKYVDRFELESARAMVVPVIELWW